MTDDQGPERVIAIVDVRRADIADLVSRPFTQIQFEHAGVADPALVDPGRVVIIDDVARLVDHHDLYAHVFDSHVDVSVLCLAVGAPAASEPMEVLRRPFQLAPPKAATLWIADGEGIGWQMDSSQADVVHSGAYIAGGASLVIPDTLLGAIGLRPVFDRVLASVGLMPGAVASPGIRAVRCDVDDAALSQAQTRAASHLAGMRTVTQAPLRPVDPDALLDRREADGRPEVLVPGGEFDLLYQRCAGTAAGADQAARRFAGPFGLFTGDGARPRGALRALGVAIKEFSEAIEQLLDRPAVRSGLDVVPRDELDRLGISVDGLSEVNLIPTAKALNEWTIDALDRHGSLPAISEKLRGAADALVPKGTAPYLDKLKRICPPAALQRLTDNPNPLAGPLPPWLALVTFAIALLAGLWPSPAAACGALAVLGIVGITLWIKAAAASVNGRASGRAGWTTMIAQSAAGLAGAAIGIAVSRAAGLHGPTGVAGIVIGAGLTVVLLGLLAALSWSALARRWVAQLNIGGWARTARSLRDLVVEAATDELLISARRLAASDLTRAMAGAADEMAVYLRGFATAASRSAGGPASGGVAVDRQGVIGDLVLADFVDAAAVTVSKIAADLRFGMTGTAAASTAVQQLESRIRGYLAHLESTGLSDPPSFTREKQQHLRRGLTGTLLERTANFVDLLETDISDVNISQLCTPEQLSMVEPEPSKADVIRFAPRPVRELLAERHALRSPAAAQVGRVEWTRLSKVAGVLRLVPIRVDAVEEVWPRADGGQVAADAAAQVKDEPDELSRVGFWPHPPPDELDA